MFTRFVLLGLIASGGLVSAPPGQAPKQLSIVKAALRQYEDGPALPAGFSFVTGESVFVSFQIQGYKVSPDAKIDLKYRMEAVDPDGVLLAEPASHELSAEISTEDKNWLPLVRETFQLPALALAGTYQVHLAVEDKLSGQTAKTELPVTVRGKHIEKTAALAATDFRFLRSEQDRDGMDPAVYHPGDTIWGRFDITGFKYGEKNHVHVEYGIALLGASGKTLYSQPQAAVEDDATYYPKRYLPGALSLSLGKDFRPGEYTIVLSLRDDVGKQLEETRHTFRVE